MCHVTQWQEGFPRALRFPFLLALKRTCHVLKMNERSVRNACCYYMNY